jgi:type I restriction-modification system DNA methylase subunit
MSSPDTNIDKQAIQDLIDKYEDLSPHERDQKKERQVQNHYIEPLLEALGWDTSSDQVMPEQRTLVGSADYSISLHGREQFYIEAKAFSKDLDGTRRVNGEEQSFVEQAIDYAWHRRVDWAILTNFEEIRLYWTHVSKENPEDGLIFKLNYNEYTAPHGLERLTNLAKENVSEGSLKQLQRSRDRKQVTKEILNELSDARLELTKDIHESHPDESLEDIREGVQRILDRIVVLRVAEDRGVIPSGGLKSRMENWQENAFDKEKEPLWEVLRSMFKAFERKYGTRIFAEHDCDEYNVSNEVIEDIIETLDGYRFEVISSDILGSIYEDYLGHAIEERGQELNLVAQEEIRRDDGIYYTPTPVVEYIIDTSIGEMLENIMEEVRHHLNQDPPQFKEARETFDQIQDIHFLDNACGSGTFLIKAYDRFVNCYEEYKDLVNEAQKSLNGNAGGDMDVGVFTEAQTIGNDFRRDILQDNIYAVDQDHQAIEIASMNLVLRALKKDQELPEILGENLKTGNSLLNGSEEEVEEVLGNELASQSVDWENEFPEVFDKGGFTCIAGNPPWGADMTGYEDWLEAGDNYELADGQYNSYTLFLELGHQILEEDGALEYIIPDSVFNDDYEYLRRWLLDKNQVEQVHKMGEGLFENVYHPTAIIEFSKSNPDPENEVGISLLKKDALG